MKLNWPWKGTIYRDSILLAKILIHVVCNDKIRCFCEQGYCESHVFESRLTTFKSWKINVAAYFHSPSSTLPRMHERITVGDIMLPRYFLIFDSKQKLASSLRSIFNTRHFKARGMWFFAFPGKICAMKNWTLHEKTCR